MSRSSNAEMLRKLREQAVAAGLCQQCRCRPQKPGCKTCEHCLDTSKERRQAYQAVGLCKCGREPRAGLSSCDACIERARRRWEKRRPKLIAAGRCLMCASPAKDGRTLCAKHLATEAAKARRRRRRKLERGLCSIDGCDKGRDGEHVFCSLHLLRMRVESRRRYRAERIGRSGKGAA